MKKGDLVKLGGPYAEHRFIQTGILLKVEKDYYTNLPEWKSSGWKHRLTILFTNGNVGTTNDSVAEVISEAK